MEKHDIEKLKHLEEQAKPLWITKQYVERPCLVILVCAFWFILSTMLSVTQGWFEQTPSSDREWYLWEDPLVIENDMKNEMQEVFKKETTLTNVPKRSEEIENWGTIVMLECWKDCDNVLTEKGINLLLKVEKEIKALKSYKNFCLGTTAHTGCSEDAHTSISSTFSDAQLEGGINTEEMNDRLDYILEEDNFVKYKYMFEKQFVKGNKVSKLLSTSFKFGAPIISEKRTFKDRYDDFDAQEDEYKEFADEIIDIAKDINDGDNGGIYVIIASNVIIDKAMTDIVNKDFMFALFSILIVWAYLTFHLGSFFLSSFSMLSVIMSFPLTQFLYKLILQVDYFAAMQILVVFIILGIAADDLFVYFDAWQQTRMYDFMAQDLNKRMAVSFRRASKAMLATSFTTGAAFFATGFSQMMPISTFGIFSGILVPMNYLLVITFFPALLIVHEKYIKDKCCTCLRKKKKQNQDIENQQVEQQQQEKQKSKVELFFENQFNTFVTKIKYVVIVITFLWMIGACILAFQLGPQTKQEQWLSDENEFQRFFKYIQNEVHTSGEGSYKIVVDMFWGPSGLDKEDVGAWDSENVGDIEWDSDFDLSPEDNQQYVFDTCEKIKNQAFVLDKDVDCFMVHFKDWLENNSQTFPVAQTSFQQKLTEFTQDSPKGQEYFLRNQIGLFKNKLHYINVQISSKGDPNGPYQDKVDLHKEWKAFMDTTNENAPDGLKNGYQTAQSWAWMVSQEEFVRNAIQGMLISLVFAFFVLLLSTFNIVIAFYSVICITGIVVSVVAIMYLLGWELGVAESITVVILIGMSVDYVVHLANHYVESSFKDKYSRMKEALGEIGISILSGSVTTLGSGLVLFLAEMSIFKKFAVLIVATICFSLYFALLFFASLMHAFGPQNRFGDISLWCKKKSQKVQSSEQGQQEQQQEQQQQQKEEDKQVEIEVQNKYSDNGNNNVEGGEGSKFRKSEEALAS